jgi:hypothetical protein
MRWIRRPALLATLVLTSVAQAQTPLPPGTWRIADAPAEMAASIARADLIVASLQGALLRELSEGLREGGPALAIVSGFAVDLGDRIGVLRPIAHRPVCASCHGPVDTRQPAVRAELRSRYPQDRALGFADGEIRGWFWVELPKSRK